jgi:pteridine reductase
MRPRALVTGAAKRVGRAIALELAANGFDVLVHCNRSVDAAEEVAERARSVGADARVFTADLASVEGCGSLVDAVRDAWDHLDVLVNNASVFEPRPLAEIDLAHWDWMHAVNSRAPFLLCRDLLPLLRRSPLDPSPAIVNLCDVGTQGALANHLAYSASKVGIEMLTKTLALELAPAIRTMGVAPGQVVWPEDYSQEKRDRLAARIPMKRVGTPEDVARLVRFLVREGDYLNGAIVPVDGGLQHRT